MGNTYYSGRRDKPAWIVKNFYQQFSVPSILDVGCDKKQLRDFLQDGVQYTGIDVSTEADVQIDLDTGERLPFEDKQFETVVAFDILEHVEHIHHVFDELCRVSSRFVLISLPNNLQSVISTYILGRSRGSIDNPTHNGAKAKFYGLPLEKPADRHRWFFDAEDAENFIRYRSGKSNFSLSSVRYELDYHSIGKRLMKYVAAGFSRRRVLNFFSGTIFFVLERDL